MVVFVAGLFRVVLVKACREVAILSETKSGVYDEIYDHREAAFPVMNTCNADLFFDFEVMLPESGPFFARSSFARREVWVASLKHLKGDLYMQSFEVGIQLTTAD